MLQDCLFPVINQLTKKDISFVSVLMGLCQLCHTDRSPRAELLLSQVVQGLPRLELEQQRSQCGLQNLRCWVRAVLRVSTTSYNAALLAAFSGKKPGKTLKNLLTQCSTGQICAVLGLLLTDIPLCQCYY